MIFCSCALRTVSSSSTEFEGHRRRLWRVAYRMLGSRAEAEDILQEVHLHMREDAPG